MLSQCIIFSNIIFRETSQSSGYLVDGYTVIQENTLENPEAVKPSTTDITVSGNTLKAELAPKSFNVYVIKL
jgi:alpha-L-arabinofuranosidase